MLLAALLVWTAVGVLSISLALWRVLTTQRFDDTLAFLWTVITAIILVSKLVEPLWKQAVLLKQLLAATPRQRKREVIVYLFRAPVLLFPLLFVLGSLIVYWVASTHILIQISLDHSVVYAFHWIFASISLAYVLQGFRETYILSEDILASFEDGGKFDCDGKGCSLIKLFPSVNNKQSNT